MSKPKPQRKLTNRKISETFLEFAGPLLAALGPNVNEDDLEQALKLAWTVWNAVVYADFGEDDGLLAELRESMESDPQLRELFEALVDLKRTDFGDEQMLVGEYTLSFHEGEIRFHAEAQDPRPAQP